MTEITGLDPVFVQNVHDLAANEAVPDGRKMQKDQNGQISPVLIA